MRDARFESRITYPGSRIEIPESRIPNLGFHLVK